MLYEDLVGLFQVAPIEEKKGGWKYIIQEQNGKYLIGNDIAVAHMSVELYFNEHNEIRLTLYKDGNSIATMQRIAIVKIEIEEDKDAIQFVLERMPSRMIRLQLYPYLAIEMGPYWEVCEDCE
ncbi:DUF3979 family protein [Bacillus cytotoxicus]|uniref:DUF3979 domain-containing protein n=1 Tax=Bacillus cytotoxicus TaxID=580165 RepID=A0AAX2CFR6_9BACI|nr:MULTISPECIES: DUF3979 family protein [Bacillus cereus group]AWC28441.1 DUF3979 domain-containing protein [Bacillus cytotoxicus]AWC40174.1 DUF3979 domain-containing protein [Bacillus cytotoxicus]AWC48105.1 DUF3979 domain-containing protein [Bacillus cytotoxicus]AWC52508.1 DUF3979 domain-containing protein [Bacillus cytotoxicus]AWC56641.1 DUF3979 domain-containing protein [Bacillus cytotoxicus]